MLIRGKLHNNFLFYSLFCSGILLLFLNPVDIAVGGMHLSMLYGEMLLLFAALLWSLKTLAEAGTIRSNNIVKYMFLLTLVGALSITTADNYGRYIAGFLNYLEPLLIVLIFSNVALGEQKITKLVNYYVVSGLYLSLLIIYNTIFVNGGNFVSGHKIALDIGASNYLASLLLIPFFIAYTMLFMTKFSLSKLFSLICLIAIGSAIIYTGSRTVMGLMFGLIFAILVLDILSRKQRMVKKVGYLLFVTICSFAVYLTSHSFIEQMNVGGRFQDLQNAFVRFDIFGAYWDAFLEHPIFGNGFMNVKALGVYYWAHNTVLQILGDCGIIAAILFFVLVVSIFKFMRNTLKITTNEKFRALIIGYRRGFIAAMLHGMFEPNFGTKLFMIYVFIGLGLVISIYNCERKSVEVA